MAVIATKRRSMMGAALALFLCVLAQAASSSSATELDFQLSFTAPPLPQIMISLPKFPSLPHVSLPPLSLPKLPNFSLPPLPSKVTIPGIVVPGLSIPPEHPLEGLHLPTIPRESIPLPSFPGINLPTTTILPPLPSFRFPGFSYPPTPAQSFVTPKFNPADFTIPSFTFHTVALPPTSFPFPRRAFPRSQIKN